LLPIPAAGADCPRKDALGTSRVMTLDPREYPRVGLKSFPQTLPLADKEVVLTFDDGPSRQPRQRSLPRWPVNASGQRSS
jgi:peptidoglycan/xylan/chitin deacetylase (PgdA/CDA1 family)